MALRWRAQWTRPAFPTLVHETNNVTLGTKPCDTGPSASVIQQPPSGAMELSSVPVSDAGDGGITMELTRVGATFLDQPNVWQTATGQPAVNQTYPESCSVWSISIDATSKHQNAGDAAGMPWQTWTQNEGQPILQHDPWSLPLVDSSTTAYWDTGYDEVDTVLPMYTDQEADKERQTACTSFEDIVAEPLQDDVEATDAWVRVLIGI